MMRGTIPRARRTPRGSIAARTIDDPAPRVPRRPGVVAGRVRGDRRRCIGTCSAWSRSSRSATRSGSGRPTAPRSTSTGPADDDHDFFGAAPVVGLVVDDFDAARASDGRGGDRVRSASRSGRATRSGTTTALRMATSTRSWAGSPLMADEAALTAPLLLRSVGLLADGPAVWGRPFSAGGPGVFVIELPSPPATAPIELTRVGKWIEQRADASPRRRESDVAGRGRPDRRVLDPVDDRSCTSAAAPRASPVASPRSTRRRSASAGRTPARTGSRPSPAWTRPGSGGRGPPRSRSTRTRSSARSAEAVPADDRARLPDRAVVLPFANLRSTAGERKAHGLSGYLVPEEADRPPQGHDRGSRSCRRATPRAHPGCRRRGRPAGRRGARRARRHRRRRRRPRRPASGRATAPRCRPPAGDPTYLSTEGIARLHEELTELTTVRRPEVIARIKSAKELGDLKENADYTAAREEQSFLEGRIAQIEGLLRTAVVIETPGRTGGSTSGSAVSVEEVGGEAARSTSTGSSARPRRIRPPAGSRTRRRSGARSSGGASGRRSTSRRRAAAVGVSDRRDRVGPEQRDAPAVRRGVKIREERRVRGSCDAAKKIPKSWSP